MNYELREKLYNEMIQNYSDKSHDEIIKVLDIIDKLDYTNFPWYDIDYIRDQLDNIINEY